MNLLCIHKSKIFNCVTLHHPRMAQGEGTHRRISMHIHDPGHMLPYLRRHRQHTILRLTLAQNSRSLNVVPLRLLTVITPETLDPLPRQRYRSAIAE